MLKETERHLPGPDKEDRSPIVTDPPPTLADLGITKKTSADAQKLADMTDEEVQIIADREQSLSQVLRKKKKEQVRQEVQLPSEKYRVVYADPPWSYGNSGVIGHADNYGRAGVAFECP